MMEEARLEAACCDLVADVVRRTGSACLKVMGSSMLPAIRPGDVLTMRRHAPEELKPGEVILYRRFDRFTVHRILRISGEYLFTRGDSLPEVDPPVRRDEVVGRVESIERNGRVIDAGWTGWQRATAWFLRRSEAGTKAYLRVNARMRQLTAVPRAAQR